MKYFALSFAQAKCQAKYQAKQQMWQICEIGMVYVVYQFTNTIHNNLPIFLSEQSTLRNSPTCFSCLVHGF